MTSELVQRSFEYFLQEKAGGASFTLAPPNHLIDQTSTPFWPAELVLFELYHPRLCATTLGTQIDDQKHRSPANRRVGHPPHSPPIHTSESIWTLGHLWPGSLSLSLVPKVTIGDNELIETN